MTSTLSRCLAAGGLSLLAWPAAADELQSTRLDLQASAGYSSNPGVTQSSGANSEGGAAFVRLSANAGHDWESERTITKLMGFAEGSEYFGKGTRSLVSAQASTSHAINERLTVSALADFKADFSGQLSNRFLNPVEPGSGPVIGPPSDNFLYSGREYRGDGQLGLVWSSSERTKLSVGAGVSRQAFTGTSVARDNTAEFASANYNHFLSERTSLGVQLTASRTDFDKSNVNTLIVNPAATFSDSLSENWKLSASLGASFSEVRRPGADIQTTDPTFSASICHETSSQHLCAIASHYAESLGTAALVEASTFGLEWQYQLDVNQAVQISAGYQHYGKTQTSFGAPQGNQYHAAASYSRRLNDRLSVGADATASRLLNAGLQHRTDFSGWLFIRYRIGDTR